jgi:hypothetical protein
MFKNKRIVAYLCMVIVTVCNLTIRRTCADDGVDAGDRPIRLYARADLGPIGTVESFGKLTVDGRPAYGKQQIWGNQLLCAPTGDAATVVVNSIGRITLLNGASARLMTTRATLEDELGHPVLVASLTKGEMSVKLEARAFAYVQAAGAYVTTSSGADFRVGIREGRIVVNTLSGDAKVLSLGQQSEPRKIEYGEMKPDPVSGATFAMLPPILDVEARSTRDIQTRVTDANDKPIPDVPVLFAVSAKGIGMFPGGATTFTAPTNAQGVASAPFTAGNSSATGSITTSVPNTDVSQTIQVKVKSKFWTPKKIIAGVGGAALITGIIIIADPNSRGPLRQVPPPTIP